MDFIAHIRNEDKEEQTVKQHLLEAKNIAEQLGSKLNIKHIAGLAALLHDFGKATNEFNEYIYTAVHNPEKAQKRGSVDHSTAGGKFIYELLHNMNSNQEEMVMAEIISNAIISHHSYLKDYINTKFESEFLRRIDKHIDEYDNAKEYFFNEVMNETAFFDYVNKAIGEFSIFIEKCKTNQESNAPLMYLTKVIFSILIDADRTNTRLFEENKLEDNTIETVQLFGNYYEKLKKKLQSFETKEDKNHIDVSRESMSKQCEKIAENPSNIYTLSIPTGGGKTFASFRYALKHALNYNKKRIIYVVPFTTIIEQNAQEIRDIIQDDENLLEHHSNVATISEDKIENMETYSKLQRKLLLAKDNWDVPIIFTSLVQYLNVFYKKGTRNIRRLHNLADAIIVFDEIQKLPLHALSLFNESINFLQNYMNTSVILCTATQPALDMKSLRYKLKIPKDSEIIQDVPKIIQAFKRVDIITETAKNPINNEQLVEIIKEHSQRYSNQLIILNTKKVVKDLYIKLKDAKLNVNLYHLSTSMCPAHRTKILNQVRMDLKNNKRVICISTQLIEAGVDISFESVIRSLSGLDSIAQASGRCNRHGRMESGHVYLINHKEEKLDKLTEIATGKSIVKSMLRDLELDSTIWQGDLLSLDAMRRYFELFYTSQMLELDGQIMGRSETHTNLLFTNTRQSVGKKYEKEHGAKYPLFFTTKMEDSAKNFDVISNMTKSVLIPYGEGEDLILDLNGEDEIEDITFLLKKAQQYSIQIYDYEERILQKEAGIIALDVGEILILKESFYSEEYGLSLEGNTELGVLEF